MISKKELNALLAQFKVPLGSSADEDAIYACVADSLVPLALTLTRDYDEDNCTELRFRGWKGNALHLEGSPAQQKLVGFVQTQLLEDLAKWGIDTIKWSKIAHSRRR